MIDQDKPLPNWTLGETMKECYRHRKACAGCQFYIEKKGCRLYSEYDATHWDLEEKPRFTQDELAAMRVFRNTLLTVSIIRTEDGRLWSGSTQTSCVELDKRLFSTIHPGQSVRLEDVLGGT